jgi:hypothetical protein
MARGGGPRGLFRWRGVSGRGWVLGCWAGSGMSTSEQRQDRSCPEETSHDDNSGVYFTHIIGYIYIVSIFDKILSVT